MNKVLVGHYQRPSSRLGSPFIDNTWCHTCIRHMWYSGPKKKITLSRPYPKQYGRILIVVYRTKSLSTYYYNSAQHLEQFASPRLSMGIGVVVERNVIKNAPQLDGVVTVLLSSGSAWATNGHARWRYTRARDGINFSVLVAEWVTR